MRLNIRFAGAALALVAVSAAQAEVTFYDLFKNVYYTQTSNAQPTTANSYAFSSRIFTDTPGEVTEGTIDYQDGDGNAQTRTLTPTSTEVVDYSDFGYASEADLEHAYPAGNYVYTATAGTLAGQTGTLTVPTTVRSDQIPYFNGTSYDDLTHAVAGSSVTVTFDGFTTPTAADSEAIYIYLHDDTTDLDVEQSMLGNAAGSYTLSGSDLVADHDYSLSIFYDPRFGTPNAGFNGTGDTSIGFDRATNLDFHVQAVPEPAGWAALGVGLVAFRRRRRA